MRGESLTIRRLGSVPYAEALERMRAFTDARTHDAPDELWLLEHPSVYTVGVRARHRLPRPNNAVPVIATDRGGDVTYHGPGQPIVYALLDLARSGLSIHGLVRALEQSVIDMLAEFDLAAERRSGAPGVYLTDRKIASLGLRVRAGRSYHGLAFNACMDLAPFAVIDPCGYPGLRVTQLSEWRPGVGAAEAGEQLLRKLKNRLEYTDGSMYSTETNDGAYRPNVRS